MLVPQIGPSELADMSARGARLEGSLQTRDLPRVAAVSGDAMPAEQLDVSVSFRDGPESFPLLQIAVRGQLPLVCQRCFGPVDWPVDVDVTLTVVPGEAAMQELADPFDSILLNDDGSLSLRDAIEDEILAVLPLAALHADPSDCPAGTVTTAGQEAGRDVYRPFADLGALMGGPGRKSDQR